MTLHPVDDYEWHEATSMEDLAHGRRVLLRGAPLDPNRAELEKLKAKIKDLTEETGDLPGALIPREQVVQKLEELLK